jgi:hypothetical protein
MKLVRRTLLALVAIAPAAVAQSDARWQAWLGCWTSDSLHAPAATLVCVTPVVRSSAVELLTVARGAIVIRERIEANGRPLPIDGNGCQGTESANWSASGRRLYLHADFSCANRTPGTTATIFSMMPTGEWLRVEKARSGGGTVLSATRLRPAPMPSVLSEVAARTIAGQQRAVVAARASSAAPIVVDEIIDAVHNLDGDVVRAWIDASQQRFDFAASQIAALANAGVPTPILDAVAGTVVEAPQIVRAEPPVVVDQGPPQMTTMRVCPANGCAAENRYSDYNGADWNNAPPYSPYSYNGYPYPYPYYAPFTTFVPFSAFSKNTNARHNPRGVMHDRPKSPPARPRQTDPRSRPHTPTPPSTRGVAPVSRRR